MLCSHKVSLLEFVVFVLKLIRGLITGDDVKAFMACPAEKPDSANDESGFPWFP
jgi:hypothetical protein